MPPSPPRPHRTAGASLKRAASAPLIRDLLASGGQAFSFEFMPPKTEAEEQQLWRAIRQLEPLRPTFVSVTYGAGGSTRDRTVRVTGRIAEETTLTPMGHLTAVRPLGGRAQAGHRVVRRSRGAQRARAARRPARRPERRLDAAPGRAELRSRAGPAGPVGRRLLRRGGRLPREAPPLTGPGDGRALFPGQVPSRGGLRDHQHVLLPRGLPAAAGPGRGPGRRRADHPGHHAHHQPAGDREGGRARRLPGAGPVVGAAAGGGGRPRRGARDRRGLRGRDVRAAARRGRAWPALLHAQLVPGDQGDLPAARSCRGQGGWGAGSPLKIGGFRGVVPPD